MMKKTLIPFKNVILENEEDYIQNMYASGFSLIRKGWLFYDFEKTTPKSITCKIDLIDEQSCSLDLNGWEILLSKKIKYKALTKVYYVSEKGNRLLTDSELKFNYYKYYQQHYLTLSSITIFSALLIFVLLTAGIKIPSILIYLALCLILPFIMFIRKYSACDRAVSEITHKKGQLTGFEANYILTFKDLKRKELENIEESLSTFGYVRRISDTTFRMQSPLEKEELFQEIIAQMNITSNNLTLMNIGDLYVMV